MKQTKPRHIKNSLIPFAKAEKFMKVDGNMIVYAVAMGMLIFTLGQGILRLQGSEARAAGALYLSEKAHYAAESGVEVALLNNNQLPFDHVEGHVLQNFENEEQSATIDIIRTVDAFGFTLKPEQAKQITLKYDQNSGFGNTDSQQVPALGFVVAGSGSFEFNKCLGSPDNEIEIVSVTNNQHITFNQENYISTLENCVIQLKNLNLIDPQTNTEAQNLVFEFANGPLSPHNTRITSVGKAGTREKHLTFSLERNKSLLNINFFQQ